MARLTRKHAVALCAVASACVLAALLAADAIEKDRVRKAFPARADVARALSGIRVPFQENAGQFPGGVAFAARMFPGSVCVTRDGGIVYAFPEKRDGEAGKSVRFLREFPVGGKAPVISGEDPASASVSRFAGNDPSRWIGGIRTWNAVLLGQVYDGVDVRIKARGGFVEKFFHVSPGADPSSIRLRVEGADRLAVDAGGGLEAISGDRTVRFTSPVAWQEDGGRKVPVAAAYEVAGNEYGFRLAGYDPGKEVVIDPLLAATYLGGSGPGSTGQGVPEGFDDQPYAIDFDSSGNVYVAGATGSSNFPAGNGYDNTFDAVSPALTDAFVVKLSPDLTQIVAATFLGGGSDDAATSVRVRGNSVYVGGATRSISADFPGTTLGRPILVPVFWHVFVVRLDLSLSNLSAGSILNGTFNDNEASLAVDGSGSVFVAGRTQSPDFPVTGPVHDNVVSDPDILPEVTDFFIAKLDGSNPSSLPLLAATYLRGPSSLSGAPNTSEALPSIAVDGNGNIVLAGLSQAADYPTTPGAYKETRAEAAPQVVVSKLSGDLSTLVASTFVGPSSLVFPLSLSLAGDNVWIGGYASAGSFPVTAGAHRATFSGGEGFVAKLNSGLSTLAASTFAGGSGADFVTGIFAAADGSVFAVGQTASADFPTTPGAYDNAFDGAFDLFLCRYDGGASALLASTLLPQSPALANRLRACVAQDGSGNVYAAGVTSSTAFPATPGAIQGSLITPSGGVARFDGFIAKFTPDLSADAVAPTVAAVSPTDGATGVPTDNTIRVRFSERMKASTLDNVNIGVSAGGVAVAGSVSYGDADNTATFAPAAPLSASTAYTVTVGTGAQDLSGNALAAPSVSTFTTAGAAAGSGGGGGGCSVSRRENAPGEDGSPFAWSLILPLAFPAAMRLRSRYSRPR